MTGKDFIFTTKSADETFGLGRKISRYFKGGDVVALYGDLGSGKTVFIQGICSGLNVKEYVTSPSFTLMQEYNGKFKVYHFDFFRLGKVSEVEDLDIDDFFLSDGISLVEWPEIANNFLPDRIFTVHLERSVKNGKVQEGVRIIKIFLPEYRQEMNLTL